MNSDIERRFNRLENMIVALCGGLMLFSAATIVLLLGFIDAAAVGQIPDTDTVLVSVIAGLAAFIVGCIYPWGAWAWDRYRDRRTVNGGAS